MQMSIGRHTILAWIQRLSVDHDFKNINHRQSGQHERALIRRREIAPESFQYLFGTEDTVAVVGNNARRLLDHHRELIVFAGISGRNAQLHLDRVKNGKIHACGWRDHFDGVVHLDVSWIGNTDVSAINSSSSVSTRIGRAEIVTWYRWMFFGRENLQRALTIKARRDKDLGRAAKGNCRETASTIETCRDLMNFGRDRAEIADAIELR